MALIRFLNKQGKCCQISSPTPILIYLNSTEKELLSQTKIGECLFLVDKTQDVDKQLEELNTKKEVMVIK